MRPEIPWKIGQALTRRYSRRVVLRKLGKGFAACAATVATGRIGGSVAQGPTSLGFREIEHGEGPDHLISPDYRADVLIRWGDKIDSESPEFDPLKQTPEAQARQFGYNCSFVGFLPLSERNDVSPRGLLCVAHYYANFEVMFPGIAQSSFPRPDFDKITKELTDIALSCLGLSIVEVGRIDGQWKVIQESRLNRRITPFTKMMLSGPVAGHPRAITKSDPSARQVLGTIANGSATITPWQTLLLSETVFNLFFAGSLRGHPDARNLTRMGIRDTSFFRYVTQFYDRFNINKEPNEANRFGYLVEIRPNDPSSVPIKRTALGRFAHGHANVVINRDGRIVVYLCDSRASEYLYKFVTHGQSGRDDDVKNGALLDSGTLFTARFAPDGTMRWLPLVWGIEPLTEEQGFQSQADVLIETRRAADLVGATPMDTPSAVVSNPLTGKVYVTLRSNSSRTGSSVNSANPRPENLWGHILEMEQPDGDHTSQKFKWNLFVLCGDPADKLAIASWNSATTENGWFVGPESAVVDGDGRLWVGTDQESPGRKISGTADGVWGLQTEGNLRGTSRMLFRVPIGAEVGGLAFTPDYETMFVSVQHPGAEIARDHPKFDGYPTFEAPLTRWPDFKDGMPPRPSVVAITRRGGGKIGA